MLYIIWMSLCLEERNKIFLLSHEVVLRSSSSPAAGAAVWLSFTFIMAFSCTPLVTPLPTPAPVFIYTHRKLWRRANNLPNDV